ncbi:type I restriction-modification system subunit M [Limosilactobacillus equigenerosi]|uniref:type I restriction-modification system subunit M n=1 Tax=Limosilactobacillus equigenerosi TaxID=417373 RepID=UPI0009E67018|nr:type I restriction-modification system subunit M [Limosilactobacillus equigenerosi]
MLFADLNMVDLQSTDILGDAYEYLIGQFASDAGKKAGEFYTPRQVSEVMAQIIAKNNEVRSIYDPTVGSGSLLLTVGKHLGKDSQKLLKYYGQEYNTETYNLTRMNLLLHGVSPDYMTIKNGNTMSQDWPEDPNRPGEGVQFDAVVMNPPYSDKKWNSHEDVPLKVSDPRFADFGTLPPDNKGDFAYLLHGLFHLGQQGTMAIVLPHGVLFRGDSEALIRQKLVDKNYLDAIIGLPSNMFKNTGIPVVVLILKKNRNLNDPVLIIDASNDFIKIGKNNVLRDQDIAKIVDTYVQKKEIPNYSHVASYDEIKENGYNLNIPRYVEAIDNELIQDVDGHLLGGIPKKAIQQLSVLKKADPESFNDSFDEIRPGYVRLNQDINELKLNVLNSTIVVRKIDNLKDELENYFKQSFSKLSSISSNSPIDLNELKESLLQEVKSILEKYENVNEYDGYQIMATLWSQYLERDLELISVSNLYEVGKTRQPHMVMKGQGSKRHEEQDGWIGTIVPNELIKNNLFGDQLNSISDLEIKFNDYQNRLDEIRDSLSEDDGEFDVLNDDNSEFNSKEVSKELKDSLSKIDIPEVNRLQDVAKFLEGKPGKQAQIDYMLEHSEINWDKIEKK